MASTYAPANYRQVTNNGDMFGGPYPIQTPAGICLSSL